MLRSTVDIERSHDFWQLASTVNSQFATGSRRGDKILSLLTVAGVMRLMLGQKRMRMGATALAYTGPLKLPQRVGVLRIRGVNAMVSNLVLGPEYTAHARIFGGRLCWDHVYLDSDMDESTAAGLTDRIFELLRQVGKESA
jgi:hypothetical protein